jgi:hypothetical protein
MKKLKNKQFVISMILFFLVLGINFIFIYFLETTKQSLNFETNGYLINRGLNSPVRIIMLQYFELLFGFGTLSVANWLIIPLFLFVLLNKKIIVAKIEIIITLLTLLVGVGFSIIGMGNYRYPGFMMPIIIALIVYYFNKICTFYELNKLPNYFFSWLIVIAVLNFFYYSFYSKTTATSNVNWTKKANIIMSDSLDHVMKYLETFTDEQINDIIKYYSNSIIIPQNLNNNLLKPKKNIQNDNLFAKHEKQLEIQKNQKNENRLKMLLNAAKLLKNAELVKYKDHSFKPQRVLSKYDSVLESINYLIEDQNKRILNKSKAINNKLNNVNIVNNKNLIKDQIIINKYKVIIDDKLTTNMNVYSLKDIDSNHINNIENSDKVKNKLINKSHPKKELFMKATNSENDKLRTNIVKDTNFNKITQIKSNPKIENLPINLIEDKQNINDTSSVKISINSYSKNDSNLKFLIESKNVLSDSNKKINDSINNTLINIPNSITLDIRIKKDTSSFNKNYLNKKSNKTSFNDLDSNDNIYTTEENLTTGQIRVIKSTRKKVNNVDSIDLSNYEYLDSNLYHVNETNKFQTQNELNKLNKNEQLSFISLIFDFVKSFFDSLFKFIEYQTHNSALDAVSFLDSSNIPKEARIYINHLPEILYYSKPRNFIYGDGGQYYTILGRDHLFLKKKNVIGEMVDDKCDFIITSKKIVDLFNSQKYNKYINDKFYIVYENKAGYRIYKNITSMY